MGPLLIVRILIGSWAMDFNRILGPISSLAHSLPLFRSLTSVTVRRLRYGYKNSIFRGPLCALDFYYFDNYWAMPITPSSNSNCFILLSMKIIYCYIHLLTYTRPLPIPLMSNVNWQFLIDLFFFSFLESSSKGLIIK